MVVVISFTGVSNYKGRYSRKIRPHISQEGWEAKQKLTNGKIKLKNSKI